MKNHFIRYYLWLELRIISRFFLHLDTNQRFLVLTVLDASFANRLLDRPWIYENWRKNENIKWDYINHNFTTLFFSPVTLNLNHRLRHYTSFISFSLSMFLFAPIDTTSSSANVFSVASIFCSNFFWLFRYIYRNKSIIELEWLVEMVDCFSFRFSLFIVKAKEKTNGQTKTSKTKTKSKLIESISVSNQKSWLNSDWYRIKSRRS